jgi:hypothetical protein
MVGDEKLRWTKRGCNYAGLFRQYLNNNGHDKVETFVCDLQHTIETRLEASFFAGHRNVRHRTVAGACHLRVREWLAGAERQSMPIG